MSNISCINKYNLASLHFVPYSTVITTSQHGLLTSSSCSYDLLSYFYVSVVSETTLRATRAWELSLDSFLSRLACWKMFISSRILLFRRDTGGAR